MAKRRKIKKSIKFIFAVILGIIIFVVLVSKNIFSKGESFNIIAHEEVWPKVYKASLVATGDGLLHSPVYMDAYNKETDTFDFSPQLELIKDIVSSYDIAYYNQETVFGGRLTDIFKKTSNYGVNGYGSYPHFNSPSEFGDAMVDIGFNMVSLASNHSADCKYNSNICIPASYDYWVSKNVVFDGFNKDEETENKYNIGEKNGITYGFLNYTNTLNGLDSTVKNISYLIDTYDEEKVAKEVQELKEKVDVVIVSMHWHKDSAEYGTVPTKSNIAIANYLNSLGVDIVLGTYSHCLQPFDIVENNGNKTIVFYSLGNIISNQQALYSSIGYKGIIGVLASMDITKTVNEDGTKEIVIDNIGADLTYTYNYCASKVHYNCSNPSKYKIVPFSKMNDTYNKDYLKIFEDYKKILTNLNNNITVKEPI